MVEEKVQYKGSCTYCGKLIRVDEYWEAFDGYSMHQLFCSRACNDKQREEEPINHQAWK